MVNLESPTFSKVNRINNNVDNFVIWSSIYKITSTDSTVANLTEANGGAGAITYDNNGLILNTTNVNDQAGVYQASVFNILDNTIISFVLHIKNSDNYGADVTFLGVGSTTTSNQATNDIIGLIPVDDVWTFRTDSAGGTDEDTDVDAYLMTAPSDVLGVHLIEYVIGTSNVKLYIDGILRATHTTYSVGNKYLVFHYKQDDAAALKMIISDVDIKVKSAR